MSILKRVTVIVALLLQGCVAGHSVDNDLALYEYDEQFWNNGTKAPAWFYLMIPVFKVMEDK